MDAASATRAELSRAARGSGSVTRARCAERARRAALSAAALALATAALAACGGLDAPTAALRPLSFAQWERERERYAGHVLAVDMWATWCEECIERFPEMVALHDRLRGLDVRFASMNLDDRSDAEALSQAERFVASQNAGFAHYRMDEPLLDGFERLGLMGIPAVLVYDRSGRKRGHFSGDDPRAAETWPALERALRALAAETVAGASAEG